MLTVTAAVIVQNGRVLAAQRSKSMQHALKWEFPGGKLEVGEVPEECIVREIAEELNMEIRTTAVLPTVHFPIENPRIALLPFAAKVVSGIPVALEHAQIAWLTLAELHTVDWSEADLPVVAWCQQNAQLLLSYE